MFSDGPELGPLLALDARLMATLPSAPGARQFASIPARRTQEDLEVYHCG